MARGRFLSRSISLSEQVDELIDAEGYEAGLFITWTIAHLDVEGRAKGGAKFLKGAICPMRDDLTPGKIESILDAADRIGLVKWYDADGHQCLWFPEFAKHQKGLRPDREGASAVPPWSREYSRSTPGVLRQKCAQVKLSKGKVSKDKRSEAKARSAQARTALVPASPSIIQLPSTKGDYPITAEDAVGWSESYPGVDVAQALRSMREWLLSNPTKRKTPKGMRRFVTAWLERDQNRGGKSQGQPPRKRSAFRDVTERLMQQAQEEDLRNAKG